MEILWFGFQHAMLDYRKVNRSGTLATNKIQQVQCWTPELPQVPPIDVTLQSISIDRPGVGRLVLTIK